MAQTQVKSIWELPNAVYKLYIEEEIASYSNMDSWIEDELAMCFGFDDLANPDKGCLYWARRHWYLTDKDGEVCLFRPTPLQWSYLLAGDDENVELKARKMGQSTVIDLKYYWRARKRKHQHMMIVAHSLDSAAELWGRIQFADRMMRENRPFMYGPTKKSNRRELEWTDTFSKLRMTTAGGKGIGRAADVDGAHLSEAAHYAGLKEVMASLGEARRKGSYLDIESTPNGYDDFRDEYIKARDRASKRKSHFYPWFYDPSNTVEHGGDDIELNDEEARMVKLYDLNMDQIAWRREKQSDLDVLFQQEHPEDDDTCFLLGGTPLFDNLKLREIEKWIFENVVALTNAELRKSPFGGNDGGQFDCWVKPIEGHHYVLPADIAEGIKGLAYSVGTVIDITDGKCEQVCEWRGHVNPFTFGIEILGPLGFWYNKALIIPERNNHGHSTIAGLRQMPYPRVYKHKSNMSSRWGRKQSDKFGFPTSSETRPQIISLLRRMLHRGDYLARSQGLIRECMAMQAEEAQFDADKITNEFRDRVFASAIGLYVRKKSSPIIR